MTANTTRNMNLASLGMVFVNDSGTSISIHKIFNFLRYVLCFRFL